MLVDLNSSLKNINYVWKWQSLDGVVISGQFFTEFLVVGFIADYSEPAAIFETIGDYGLAAVLGPDHKPVFVLFVAVEINWAE
jgi:hypothetical protein